MSLVPIGEIPTAQPLTKILVAPFNSSALDGDSGKRDVMLMTSMVIATVIRRHDDDYTFRRASFTDGVRSPSFARLQNGAPAFDLSA
jgi:hypothetical protein